MRLPRWLYTGERGGNHFRRQPLIDMRRRNRGIYALLPTRVWLQRLLRDRRLMRGLRETLDADPRPAGLDCGVCDRPVESCVCPRGLRQRDDEPDERYLARSQVDAILIAAVHWRNVQRQFDSGRMTRTIAAARRLRDAIDEAGL